MPTVLSKVDLYSNVIEERRYSLKVPNNGITAQNTLNNNDTIPRNQSISGFVRDKFAEINSVIYFFIIYQIIIYFGKKSIKYTFY